MNLTDLYLGAQPAWKKVMARVESLASTSWPVLLVGPRGCGKTLLAEHIHRRSGRPGEFVPGPAPSIPESLLQGELLGHARGAFTDARAERKGMLELAHRGTLFLDEIEAASYTLQSLLVGQVERVEVRRVGDVRPRQVDVRYIYASNADLRDLAGRGRFRPDLLDRIGGLELRVPALTDYRGALLPLAHEFIREDSAALGRDCTAEFSLDVIGILLSHTWPGNLRELRNVCREIALRLPTSRTVVAEDLPEYLLHQPAPNPARLERQVLREQVDAALREAQGNKSEAARQLNVSRTRFGRMLERVRRISPSSGQRRAL